MYLVSSIFQNAKIWLETVFLYLPKAYYMVPTFFLFSETLIKYILPLPSLLNLYKNYKTISEFIYTDIGENKLKNCHSTEIKFHIAFYPKYLAISY